MGGNTFNSCTLKTYSVVPTPGTSYIWTVPTNITYVQTGNVIVVDYAATSVALGATAQVTCTASNGTGTSAAKILNVKRAACPFRVSDHSANTFSVKAYPNPSSSEFTIQTSAKGAMSIKVYDMQGRLAKKAHTDKIGSKLAAGVYNLIVTQDSNVRTLRVIKQ